MGTTITAILVAKDNLVVAHVGDSRIYRLRNGELTQITEDHSLLNHLINIGELKKEDAKGHANKNVILRAVGLKDYVEVATQVVAKVPGDQYMMCSDGLSDLVDDFVIAEVMRTAPSLKDACDQLIRLALHAGGRDNVTVIIAEVEEYIDDRPDRAWTTGIFSAIPLQQQQQQQQKHSEAPSPPARRSRRERWTGERSASTWSHGRWVREAALVGVNAGDSAVPERPQARPFDGLWQHPDDAWWSLRPGCWSSGTTGANSRSDQSAVSHPNRYASLPVASARSASPAGRDDRHQSAASRLLRRAPTSWKSGRSLTRHGD